MQFNTIAGNEFYNPLHRFLRELPKDYIGTMAQVQARHGNLVHWRVFGGLVNFAFISDAAVNRELFVRNTEALEKSASQVQTFLFAAGPTVATSHGKVWRTKRKEANALFSRTAIEASCAGQVDVIRDYVASLTAAPHDAIALARRMAALTASRGILGHAISLDEADTQIAFSKAAALRFNAESAHLFARPNWMLAPWRRTLARRKAEVFPIVQKAIDTFRNSDMPNDGLMNHFVKGEFTTSKDDEILATLVGLLMGAQDNIAAAVAWILAFLAQETELQDKIRAEVATTGFEARELMHCPLLVATLSEVLRMRPPAPANQPRALKQEITIAGHRLPKGTFVLNSIYNMHHDPVVFAHPDQFDPTRFLDRTLERSPSFAPFGHGPRNCVAQGMAMQQLMAIVVGILREHKVLAQQGSLPEIRQLPFLVPAPFNVVVQKT